MISEIIQYIYTYEGSPWNWEVMLDIFERMQQRLQKVVAYMQEWCSLCKVILQLIFACLFTMIIYREHIA